MGDRVVGDVIFIIIAVTWMVLSSLVDNGAMFASWLGVLIYAGINFTENRLRSRE